MILHCLLWSTALALEFTWAATAARAVQNVEQLRYTEVPAWSQIVDRLAEGEKVAATAILQNIVDDQGETPLRRREAALQLGRLGSETALAFLAERIGLHIAMDVIKMDEDVLKEYPCMFSLSKLGRRALPPLFKALEQQRTRRQIANSCMVLEAAVGSEAKALARAHLAAATSEPLRKNLESLLAYLTN